MEAKLCLAQIQGSWGWAGGMPVLACATRSQAVFPGISIHLSLDIVSAQVDLRKIQQREHNGGAVGGGGGQQRRA